MTGESVVGVDIGATSTRAVAVAPDGSVLGRGTSAGANPNSHPPELAGKRVAEAVAAALGAADPGGVRHCVLGLAGVSKLSDPDIGAVFEDNLHRVGLDCPVTAVSDAEAAYASATAEPDGTVLVGGTGSIAVRIVARRQAFVVGGYGWLLGDDGSAFWIGREAVRATLDAVRAGPDIGPLAAAVLTEALGTDAVTEPHDWRSGTDSRLITAANAEPPIRLARFATLVSAHAATDPRAARIVAAAAGHLTDQALRARSPGAHTPVVLVGSVVGPGSPVGETVRTRLVEHTGDPVLFATDAAAGAAWLAALKVLGTVPPFRD
ncbi:MAG TPA: BadF/BadG/BcrA/BcrD ATPase family protein [Actinophytocola sp.]|uniref:N-acetylglucosamine kinase n=1 Tax=Actinophytocola sp. TaxID=1872138 RepID=UPI002DBB15E1|nr:BadF/BadG/BcrA/BcrD ATPase family protein [Actinophytocola sp.]HEU5471736.1 BadF/BadG/BcrA/BcrD ATPase family protein [Actinophytocola sp.]